MRERSHVVVFPRNSGAAGGAAGPQTRITSGYENRAQRLDLQQISSFRKNLPNPNGRLLWTLIVPVTEPRSTEANRLPAIHLFTPQRQSGICLRNGF
jgi:hypothetical protein